MKLYIIPGLLAIVSLNLCGQTLEQKDSLVQVMCETIIESKGQPDTIRIQAAYTDHLYPFLLNYPEEKIEEIGMSIFFRFQRNCVEFAEILDALNPPKGDWERVAEKPKSKLNKSSCREFLDHKDYTYLEATGDTVKLRIEGNYWIDYFKDGTYSKLRFDWVSACEFEIEFLESNNDIRKNFSKPGDIYRYQILDKKDNYYDMSVEIEGVDTHLMFKMYY